MFTVTNIVEKLNFFDIDCDNAQIINLIKELKLEPIFEDEKSELYYDDEAYEALKNRLEDKKSDLQTMNGEIVLEENEENLPEKQQTPHTSLIVDNAGKNIEVIAQTISQRITADLAEYIKKNLSVDEAFKAGIFKRDNEVLAKKLQDTINDNKKLIQKIRQLEQELQKFHPVFGNVYVKSK